MRVTQMVGLLATLLIAAGAGHADPDKFLGKASFNAKVLAYPNFSEEPVGQLKKGQTVVVLQKADDQWYAIAPPPGSVSFVNHRFLGRLQPEEKTKDGQVVRHAVIAGDNVEVRVGTSGPTPIPTPKCHVKLQKGTIVTVIGEPVTYEDSPWYPIAPPDGDRRWVVRSAIGEETPLTPPPNYGVIEPASASPSASPGTPGVTGAVATVGAKSGTDDLWKSAETAEQARDYLKALSVYKTIYEDLRQHDRDREKQLLCYNRILDCQEKIHQQGIRPASGTSSASPVQPDSARPRIGPPGSGDSPPQTGRANSSPAVAAVKESAWSKPGTIRKTSIKIEGKPAYALTDPRGDVMCYVTAGPEIDLDAYVYKGLFEIYGAKQYRTEMRTYHYEALKVLPVQ